MQRFRGYYSIVGVGSLLLSAVAVMQAGRAAAQSLPECQPPRADEYLLLVPNQRADTQTELQKLLPANAVLTPCNYLNSSVVRVEGFASADIATAWAQYLADTASLQAYVARPATEIATAPAPSGMGGTSSPTATPAVTPTASPATTATPAATPTASPATTATPAASPATPAAATTPTYSPQPLGAGYAVVVNYFNQPGIAADVRRVTTRDVGLVAFEQQPYLLASHTTDANTASALLRTLSERGLTAAIIDSRRAMLLTPTVKLE